MTRPAEPLEDEVGDCGRDLLSYGEGTRAEFLGNGVRGQPGRG